MDSLKILETLRKLSERKEYNKTEFIHASQGCCKCCDELNQMVVSKLYTFYGDPSAINKLVQKFEECGIKA